MDPTASDRARLRSIEELGRPALEERREARRVRAAWRRYHADLEAVAS